MYVCVCAYFLSIFISTLDDAKSMLFTDLESHRSWMAMGFAAWFVASPHGSTGPASAHGARAALAMRRLGGRIVMDAGHSRNLIGILIKAFEKNLWI